MRRHKRFGEVEISVTADDLEYSGGTLITYADWKSLVDDIVSEVDWQDFIGYLDKDEVKCFAEMSCNMIEKED